MELGSDQKIPSPSGSIWTETTNITILFVCTSHHRQDFFALQILHQEVTALEVLQSISENFPYAFILEAKDSLAFLAVILEPGRFIEENIPSGQHA